MEVPSYTAELCDTVSGHTPVVLRSGRWAGAGYRVLTPSQHSRSFMVWCCLWLVAEACLLPALQFVSAVDEETSPSQTLYARSLQILQRQPRPGAALDRVLQYHEERNSFPQFRAELVSDQAQKKDLAAAAILGMTESFLGHHQAARQALLQAVEDRPRDPIMHWLLGQTCLKQNDPAAAVDHLQQAVALKPNTADLLPIARDLVVALRRTGRNEQIAELWKSMEQQIGPNERVAEQLANIVRESGDLQEAIRRFEELARTHSDPWKATQFGITAADLKQQAGQSEAAIRDLGALLNTLAPDSAQARQVRTRLEDAFRRSGDLPGLVTWLERRLVESPDDLESLLQLAPLLAQLGRPQDAERRLRDALPRASSNIKLRRSLIKLHYNQREFERAATVYEGMDTLGLLQSEDIDAWGKLCLQLPSLSSKQRQEQAARVWKKLVEGHSEDPGVLRQTALRLRTVAPPEEVVALYESALQLAPKDIVTREQYGEYLLEQRRPEDALRVWRAIADGDRPRPELLRALAAILQRYGQTHEAISTLRDACTLDPDFEELLRLARLMAEYREGTSVPFADQCLQLLAQAQSPAASADDAERVLQVQVLVLQNMGQLTRRIGTLQSELLAPGSNDASGSNSPTVERWLELATLCQAAERLPDAVQATEKALEMDPESVHARRLMTRLYRASGRLADALRQTQELLRLEPRLQSVHLRTLAELELELGHLSAAADAARTLATMSDGSIEAAAFSSQLLMQAGQFPEALRILKRVATANPEDSEACLNYLTTLIDARQTEQAEVYCWQLMERPAEDDVLRLRVIPILAELLQQSGRTAELPARLEQLLAGADNTACLARCLSAAWLALGDNAAARRTLEQLLETTEALPEDSLQLADLCLAANDVAAAQQVLARLRPEQLPDTLRTQAEDLLLRAVAGGADDLSATLLSTRLSREELLGRADQLLADRQSRAAFTILKQLSATAPDDPRLLIRLAISQWNQASTQQAVPLFHRFLEVAPRPPICSANPADIRPSAPAIQDRGATSIKIPDIPWWKQQFEKSNRILLATDRITVLDLRRCLEEPASAALLALVALARDADQQGQFSQLLEEFERAASHRATAAWDLWALRRLRGLENTATRPSLADSLRLLETGQPDGPAALLADVMSLFGTPRSSLQNPAETEPVPLDPASPEPLTSPEFSLIVEAFATSAERLSAEDLCAVSNAIIRACLAEPVELRQLLTTRSQQLRNQTDSVTSGLIALRLATDLARNMQQPPPPLPEVLSVLSRNSDRPERHSSESVPWTESGIRLVTDVIMAAPGVLSGETTSDVLNWWIQWKARYPSPRNAANDSARIPQLLFSTDSSPGPRDAFSPLVLLLTPTDRKLLEQLATAMRHESGVSETWSERWRSDMATRSAAERVPAALGWMAVSDPAVSPEVQTAGLEVLAQSAPEDPLFLIWQMADFESQGFHTEALERLDRLSDKDPEILRARELKALTLAALSGSQRRAEVAVARLQGFQLSTGEQTEFLRLLRLSGLSGVYAEEVRRHFPTTSTLTPERQLEQLNLLVARGQFAEAVQMAEGIVRSTASDSGSRFRRNGRITADDVRRRAEAIRLEFGQKRSPPLVTPAGSP